MPRISRSSGEIIVEMLEVLGSGEELKRSTIAYRCEINYDTATKKLAILEKRKWIIRNRNNTYTITEEGKKRLKHAINAFSKLEKIFNGEGHVGHD